MLKTNNKEKFSKLQLEKLKNNIKIEEIVGKSFVLEKFGKNHFTTCPFCGGEKSLSISTEKQFGYCFSCNESFDVFGFYQKVKGLSFVQSVIEVKKHINLNNNMELQKLLKASIYFTDLKQCKNPISNEPIKSVFLKTQKINELLNKIDWILVFLISDYSNLNQEKYLLLEEVDDCEHQTQKILDIGFDEEPLDSQKRLTNLFKYILELLTLIKDNNCNLSGIVYGLN